MQVVRRGIRAINRDGISGAAFADFDKGSKEVVEAVAQLLHVGVLIGRPLVSVYGEALVDDITSEVLGFSQRFHDELLEVFRKENEGIFVGQNHHVAFTLAISFVIPGKGELECCVSGRISGAGLFVHHLGSFENAFEIDALQSHGDESDGREHGGAAADPVFHGEGGDEALVFGKVVELGILASDGDGVLGEVEARFFVGGLGLDHTITGLRSSAGF